MIVVFCPECRQTVRQEPEDLFQENASRDLNPISNQLKTGKYKDGP
jgi:hypothetical protein